MASSSKRFDVKHLPGFSAIAIGGFVMLYLPLAILVFYSFNGGAHLGSWEGFSLRWYGEALANDAIRDATLRSFGLALTAASLGTTGAVLAALATTRSASFKPAQLIYMIISQPLMVPEIVLAVALLLLFSIVRQATGYSGMGYLVAAHTTFCIPFAYMPIRARLEGMDQNLEIAAADLYADPFVTFRRVTLPLLMPGVMAGLMLAFVVSLDDVVISQFVKSAGQETLPTYMLGQLRRGISGEVYAIASLLLGLSATVVSAFAFLNNQKN